MNDHSAVELLHVSKSIFGRVLIDKRSSRLQRIQALLSLCGLRRPVFSARNGYDAGKGDRIVLNDITASINQGSVTAVIGSDDSGKGELLRLIGGYIRPTSGTVLIRGTAVSLLDGASELDEHASARENIREAVGPCDTLVGLTESVLDFAELHDFADVFFSKYSSGMRVRLAVAIAFARHSDILILGDVLGVGDIRFRDRCIQRVRAEAAAGRTILLSSSDSKLVATVCTHALWLEHGSLRAIGLAAEVLPEFSKTADDRDGRDRLCEVHDLGANEQFHVCYARIAASDARQSPFSSACPLILTMQVRVLQDLDRLYIVVGILQRKQTVFRSVVPEKLIALAHETLEATVTIPSHLLAPGSYHLELQVVGLQGTSVFLIKRPGALHFKVSGAVHDHGPICLPLDWACTKEPGSVQPC